ncbi:MAG: ATP-binding cassette domain-containing protein [Christensenellales bacterium]|jgi:ABC-type nitrate/sulfonate/bicarbonate transport system ATPase subunit
MRIEGLTKAYGEKIILQDFTLELPERGVVCLLGPSGCGKTTLLHLLAGLIPADGGRVVGLPGPLSMVFQEDRLLPWLTCQENIALVGVSRDAARRALEAVGLFGQEGVYPDALSGGMRRRVALARALAAPHGALLLDEPFKGLDRATQQPLLEQVRAHGEEHLVLAVTHDPWQVDALGAMAVRLSGPPLRLER